MRLISLFLLYNTLFLFFRWSKGTFLHFVFLFLSPSFYTLLSTYSFSSLSLSLPSLPLSTRFFPSFISSSLLFYIPPSVNPAASPPLSLRLPTLYYPFSFSLPLPIVPSPLSYPPSPPPFPLNSTPPTPSTPQLKSAPLPPPLPALPYPPPPTPIHHPEHKPPPIPWYNPIPYPHYPPSPHSHLP